MFFIYTTLTLTLYMSGISVGPMPLSLWNAKIKLTARVFACGRSRCQVSWSTSESSVCIRSFCSRCRRLFDSLNVTAMDDPVTKHRMGVKGLCLDTQFSITATTIVLMRHASRWPRLAAEKQLDGRIVGPTGALTCRSLRLCIINGPVRPSWTMHESSLTCVQPAGA